MASKFSDFLKSNQIDTRRLLIASRRLERLRPEDRQLRLKKKAGEAKPAAESAEGEAEASEQAATKPRSGRPVTPQLLQKAEEGKRISGPSKTRLLRAVNRILEQKSKDPVSLRELF